MKTLLLILGVTLFTFIGKFTGTLSAPTQLAETVHQLNDEIADAMTTTNPNQLQGMGMSADEQTIADHVAQYPDEAPYWFGLLSTLTASLVAAIIRVLEKRFSGSIATWRQNRRNRKEFKNRDKNPPDDGHLL